MHHPLRLPDIKKQAARFALTLIVFLDMLGFTLVIPLLAPLLLGTSFIGTANPAVHTAILGALLSIYAISQFFGAPVLGALSDRYGRKRMLLLSLAGNMIGYIAFGMGIMLGSLWLLFAARLFQGFTSGNISIALSAMADVSEEHNKARNFGLIAVAFGAGIILGPWIGGRLSDPTLASWFNFATPLWFAAGVTCFTILLCIWLFPETALHRVCVTIKPFTGITNLKRALQLPNLRIMFIVMFLIALGFNFLVQFFQVFLLQKFSFGQGQIGDIYAYAGLWIVLTQCLFTHPLSHRFKPHQLLPWFAILAAAATGFLVLPTTSFALLFIIPFVLIGQGVMQPNAIAIVSNLAGNEQQGEVLGINQSIQSLGMILPPLISGLVVTVHQNLPILIGAGLTLLAALTFVIFYTHHKNEEAFSRV